VREGAHIIHDAVSACTRLERVLLESFRTVFLAIWIGDLGDAIAVENQPRALGERNFDFGKFSGQNPQRQSFVSLQETSACLINQQRRKMPGVGEGKGVA